MSRRNTTLLVGGAGVVALALLAWTFNGNGDEPIAPGSSNASAATPSRTASSPSAAIPRSEEPAAEPRRTSDSEPRVLPDHPTPLQLIDYCEPTDLRLLSNLGRLNDAPTTEAGMELIRRSQRGATEDELRAYIDESMAHPVLGHAFAIRWWRATTGRPPEGPQPAIATRPSTAGDQIVQGMNPEP